MYHAIIINTQIPSNLIEKRIVGNYIIKTWYGGMTIYFGDEEDMKISTDRLTKFFGESIRMNTEQVLSID